MAPAERGAARAAARALGSRKEDERGVAMIIAVTVMLVMALLTTLVFTAGLQALPQARHEQDYQAALQAADAGVEDYINRLNSNLSYYSKGDPVSSSTQNPAFTQWTPVPGVPSGEWFKYAVDNAQTAATGVVHLIAYGLSGPSPSSPSSVVRVIDVGIKRGYTNWAYWTNYELLDWRYTGQSPGSDTRCILYAWQYNAHTGLYGPDWNSCGGQSQQGDGKATSSELAPWPRNITVNGPFFSNDAVTVCSNTGPTFFNGTVTTAYNQATSLSVSNTSSYGGPGTVLRGCQGSSPSPGTINGVQPAGSPPQPPPAPNGLSSIAKAGGCLYSGPVTLTFHSNGKVSVYLPSGSTSWSKSKSKWTSKSTSCGQEGHKKNNVLIPPNGVMYDWTANADHPARVTVSGTVKGQVTVGSEGGIVIDGNRGLRDASTSGTDMIGLSAAGRIGIQAPGASSGESEKKPSGCTNNFHVVVQAAMVMLRGSLYVQQCAGGSGHLRSIVIDGSLAQKYEGSLGSTSSGNNSGQPVETINYDPRLNYQQPPYFTTRAQTNWTKVSFAECPSNLPFRPRSSPAGDPHVECKVAAAPSVPPPSGSSGDEPSSDNSAQGN